MAFGGSIDSEGSSHAVDLVACLFALIGAICLAGHLYMTNREEATESGADEQNTEAKVEEVKYVRRKLQWAFFAIMVVECLCALAFTVGICYIIHRQVGDGDTSSDAESDFGRTTLCQVQAVVIHVGYLLVFALAFLISLAHFALRCGCDSRKLWTWSRLGFGAWAAGIGVWALCLGLHHAFGDTDELWCWVTNAHPIHRAAQKYMLVVLLGTSIVLVLTHKVIKAYGDANGWFSSYIKISNDLKDKDGRLGLGAGRVAGVELMFLFWMALMWAPITILRFEQGSHEPPNPVHPLLVRLAVYATLMHGYTTSAVLCATTNLWRHSQQALTQWMYDRVAPFPDHGGTSESTSLLAATSAVPKAVDYEVITTGQAFFMLIVVVIFPPVAALLVLNANISAWCGCRVLRDGTEWASRPRSRRRQIVSTACALAVVLAFVTGMVQLVHHRPNDNGTDEYGWGCFAYTWVVPMVLYGLVCLPLVILAFRQRSVHELYEREAKCAYVHSTNEPEPVRYVSPKPQPSTNLTR